MARRMVVGRLDGETPVLVEVGAHVEAELHDMMMSHPELLPVDEFDLEGPLLVVGKETVLASESVDLVGLTPSGDVVIIEFKTAHKTRTSARLLPSISTAARTFMAWT
jgi:hypothetical protein